jgi:hypothetical protein
MATCFHPFMEYSDDLNQPWLNRAIVENMNWLLHVRSRSIDAGISHMKTAKAGRAFVSSLGERAFGIGRDHSHRCGEEESVPASADCTPSLGADR